MSFFAEPVEPSGPNTSVEIILEKTCPKHLDNKNLCELTSVLRAMVGLGRYLVDEGTGDHEITIMYRKVCDKFCAHYPRHLYRSLHELLRVAIQFPDEITHYSPAHKFGMSKNRLKKHPKQFALYMRTCEFQCQRCHETKSGSEYSDRRLVGRRKRRVCNDCDNGGSTST